MGLVKKVALVSVMVAPAAVNAAAEDEACTGSMGTQGTCAEGLLCAGGTCMDPNGPSPGASGSDCSAAGTNGSCNAGLTCVDGTSNGQAIQICADASLAGGNSSTTRAFSAAAVVAGAAVLSFFL